MKKKILITTILAIIMIFSIQLSIQAVVVSTDKEVQSGSGTVTIAVTSQKALGAYTLKLIDTAGLTLVNASGGEISADKKTITGSAANGTTALGTYTFNVPTVSVNTKYNIKFSITGMETPSLDIVPDETNTAVLTVIAPVVEKPKPQPQPEPEPEPPAAVVTPNFTQANKTMYAAKDNMNLRESWSTKSNATTIKKGTELKVTGISTNKVNDYVWYRVSYNGKTLYVANYLLTDTKPTEEPKVETPVQEPPVTTEEPTNNDPTTAVEGSLKSLEIEGVTLTPTFSSNVYEYRVIVKENISELKINAVAKSSDSKITIAGNKDIQEGENLIIIMVYNAKNEAEGTYQITVNKNTLDLTDTDNILKIGNEKAKRNLILFIALFVVAIVALAVVLILKNKHQNQDSEEQDFADNNPLMEQQEIKEFKQENPEEKKKGKHF